MAELTTTTISTAGGVEIEVRHGGSGPALVWFHGLVGLAHREPALEALADSFAVHAPVWPGYGDVLNESSVEDMLDFALLGWDIVDALALDKPHVIGHSFGAMIAAEMACVARHDLTTLTLVTPFGLWLDEHPITDPFAQLPFQLTELLFTDPTNASTLVAPGVDLESDEGLAEFMVSNSRRLGTAGKIMFPIPNRRLSKRLYRISVPTRIIMAAGDRLITRPYADAWRERIDGSEVVTIDGAGHMVNLEQPDRLASAVTAFLGSQTSTGAGTVR
ncbi:MAG: alpha/beta hydrolase [Acidimicrobiales bacterium]